MGSRSKSSVLVVDDTETNIDILVETLGDTYDVSVAMDGESALEIVASDPPDLILLDIMMPGMDGYEVCRRLKADDKTNHIPVVFVTAMDQVTDETKGFELGAADFITKPISPLIVLARVRSILSLKEKTEQMIELSRLESLRQRDFIRETFGRYLSSEVVDELLGSPDGLEMGGETREVTFLVSDLRGFTSLSSRLSSQEVISILNRYLERMMEIIARYRGTVNEIEGDGILVFFGAPLTRDDDPERAVACAIEMQNVMAEINEEQKRSKLPMISMGIGINTGDVVVGNIGCTSRAKYSAIGSPINTAYRVESYTVGGQILLSPFTYEKVKSLVHVQGTIKVQFKGSDHPVTVYDVSGMGGEYQLFLPKKKIAPFTKLEPPVPINCFPLEDSAVSDTSISGHITHLGESAAEIAMEQEVNAHTNLKILFTVKDSIALCEGYAKVVSVESSGSTHQNRTCVEFTWLSGELKKFIEKKRIA